MYRMFKYPFAFICLINAFCLNGQINFTSSNLPIMIVDTDGNADIPDDPKIDAQMKLINNGPGQLNHILDLGNEYAGKIGIEIRGSSSADLFPKKGFGFETRLADNSNNNVSLLEMPEENDWVLHGPYSDKSLVRNALAYLLAAELMEYAPRVRHLELVVNGNYRGVYLLTEKIKRDKGRVDISKLNPVDIAGDELTGGYIIKIDKTTGDGNGWNSGFNYTGETNSHDFLYHDPKYDELADEQKDYIQKYMFDFESMMDSDEFNDPINGYPKWIDEFSFMGMFFVNEMSKNVDGYRLSTYLYKDKDSVNPRLKGGPVWDFNLGFGNANYCEGESPQGWAYEFNDVCPGDYWNVPFFWEKLFDDPSYRSKIKNRWEALRSDVLSNESILNKVDSLENLLQEPQQRNFEQWPTLGEWVWPNYNVADTYNEEMDYMKDWIKDRLEWMDGEIALFDATASLNNSSNSSHLILYPNPAQNVLNLQLNVSVKASLDLVMFDARGNQVYQEIFEMNSLQHVTKNIRINTWAIGLYYYIVMEDGEVKDRGSWVKVSK